MSVQIGFVCGALASALLNLADRIRPQTFFAICAVIGATANALIALMVDSIEPALVLRFITGACLAGVYPPAMKVVATWTRVDRGLGIGILVGAITVGSALPYLLSAFSFFGDGGLPPWPTSLLLASGSAIIGAAICALFVSSGPYTTRTTAFSWRNATHALSHRPMRLANFGYLGHMWELYGMWTWIPIFLIASFKQADISETTARLVAFAVIASGGLGSVLGGKYADKIGRTTVAIVSLTVSGFCALIAGLFFSSPVLLTIICLVWGFAVVTDSAQFSAAVSEISHPEYIGTALTIQTCMGYLLTLVTIRIIPPIVDLVGWEWAFIILVPGPIMGILSMRTLRQLPEAARMASGHR